MKQMLNVGFGFLLVCLSCAYAYAVDSKQIKDESARLNDFFADIYEKQLKRSPMQQSNLGIKDDYDKWDDISDQKVQEDLEIARRNLKHMQKEFDFNKLDAQAKLSYRLYKQGVENDIEGARWQYHNYPVNQMHGMHTLIPSFLINIHRVDSLQDAQAYIARLNGVKKLLKQLIVKLETREGKGILPPKFVYPYGIQDSQNVISGIPFDKGPDLSPLYKDFKRKLDALSLDDAQKKNLLKKAKKALLTSVKPGYEKLIAVLKRQETVAGTDDGAWRLPNGDEYYAYRLKKITTTDLTPEEIHQYGLSEVARIHNEMRDIMKKVKFKGSLNDFFQFMQKDKQFYYSDSEEGRSTYLKLSVDLVDKMKTRLDEVFITKPKADIIVKAVEPFREKSAGWAFYREPAPDGSRPGTFYVNLYRMSDNPSYTAEALAYHEGIPGHHMQISIAQELKNIPKFRKYGGYTAYIEGWGLYSEKLPKEMGFYQDPYSDFGRLSMELWRAIRLVVDTGLHYKKWTRQQTIDYHVKNAPQPKERATGSTERYIVIPGQATAYKIGMRKILELRALAKKQLGDKFSLGEYHDVVLINGALPLSILEENVKTWIDTKTNKG